MKNPLRRALLKVSRFRSVVAEAHAGKLSYTAEPYIHRSVISDGVTENINPFAPPAFVKVINNAGGHKYYVKNLPFFENTQFEGFILED